jgi:hypothetical protein
MHQSHIVVTVTGIEREFTWLSATTIELNSAADLDAPIFIKRVTNREERMVDYTEGTLLSEEVLNIDSKQSFYLVQEAFDWITLNQDEDGLVFHDREAILNAITGWVDESVLTEEVSANLDYVINRLVAEDAIYRVVDGDMYEEGILESPLRRITYSEFDCIATDAKIVLHAGKIEDLETEGGDLETRITSAEIDIDGAEAAIVLTVADIVINGEDITYNAGEISLLTNEYMVRLDNNGYVAGFGLYNDGEGESQFIINVDKFALIQNDGTGLKTPFVVSEGVVAIDGTLMVLGSIWGNKIAANAITAEKINVSTLSAIAANIGTVTAGVIQSTNWGPTAGSHFNLATGKLQINSAEGITINGGGDISLVAGEDDAAEITFSGGASYPDMHISMHDANKTLCFYPDVADDMRVYFGFDRSTYSQRRLEIFRVDCTAQAVMEVVDPDTKAETQFAMYDTFIYLRSKASALGSYTGFYINPDYIKVIGDMHPYGHKFVDLGRNDLAYDHVYADHHDNVADMPWFDDRKDKDGNVVSVDDLAVIHGIKPSNNYDPLTGFRTINDSTLPTWLVTKHHKDGEEKNEDGDRIRSWERGDVAVNPDGKPYLDLMVMIGLLMGAVRQLDNKIEAMKG